MKHSSACASAMALAIALSGSIASAQTGQSGNAPEGQPVVVTGSRPKVINKVDRKVYRTDADLQSATGSAADVLGNIPSVDVDPDGNVALRGDSSVTILIDGKPAPEFQGAARGAALQAMGADQIQQIEVITSPSAEFKPDGSGGIINIVTKKTRKKPPSAIVQLNAGNAGRYGFNASGTYSKGPWDLSGGVGIRHDNRSRVSDIDTTTEPAGGGVTHGHQTIRNTETRTATTVRAAVDYAWSDTKTVGLSLNYLTRQEKGESRETFTNSGASTSAYERFNQGGGPRTNASAAVHYDQLFAREGEKLSVNLQTGEDLESNVYDYRTRTSAPLAGSELTRQLSQEAYRVSELTVTYERPLGPETTLKLGYDGEYDQTAFDNSSLVAIPETGVPVPDPASGNLFRYQQVVHAAYVTLGRKWNRLEVLGGLRAEQVDIQTLQRVSGDASTQSYAKLYPTLNMVYNLSETDSLTAGYSRRVQKPDPEDLNPYINASDPHNLRQGNPDLRPELTDSLELGYRHEAGAQYYQVTGFYRRSRDGDTEVLRVISSDVLLVTKENMPQSQSGGVEFAASAKLMPKLSATVSGTAFYNEINTQSLGIAGTRGTVTLNAKTAFDYQPGSKDRWQVSANYAGKRLTPQGYIQPVATLNLGYRHQFSDRIALVGTVSDVFNSARWRRYYQTPTFTGVYDRHQAGQVAYVGLTYTFGGSKKAKDAAFSYDQGG